MKRNTERRQRLGGEALPRRKATKIAASANWSALWDGKSLEIEILKNVVRE
jgi:hypothetical protein